MKKKLLVLIFFSTFYHSGYCWLYPEHRDIMIKAIQMLDPNQRKLLEDLWGRVRIGHESRLAPWVIDTTQELDPKYLDYGAWPGISGDHSCSPMNLTNTILYSDWIMQVAAITAKLKANLAKARNSSEKDNAMRDADIKLLRADPEYASRAGGNCAHFKLALQDINTSANDYMNFCVKAGTPLNISGIYTWFHERALYLASLYQSQNLSQEERNSMALAILANEAFGIHFLEDCFASGHVAGIWGDASQRKGTHDYYNAAGFQITTWQGERMVLMGDAYMRTQDEERCAFTVKKSLEQLLTKLSEPLPPNFAIKQQHLASPDTFNVCLNQNMPSGTFDSTYLSLTHEVLATTPVPGLASGPGAMPRVSTELGPFIGFATGVRGTEVGGGFSKYQKTAGFVPGLEIALRVGLGLEGLLNESSDGLTFLDLGWRLDGPSSMKVMNDSLLKQLGSFASAIPSRDAFFMRLRLPFYLIPGDLILLAPILFFASPEAMNKVVVTAGNGGLIPWQKKLITRIGSFQFVLGREIGVSLYGYGNEADVYIFGVNNPEEEVFCGLHTTQLNFPIVEYKVVRAYGSRQSADIFLQLTAGIDIPGKRTVLLPAGYDMPPLQNIYSIGLRLVFDYRHYFGKTSNLSK